MLYEPYIYARDMQAAEACAVADGDTSYISLMDTAGTSAASYLLENGYITEHSTVLVLCGTGNNGGDGYVIARRLAQVFPSRCVYVLAVGGYPKTESAVVMCEQVSACPNVRIIGVRTENDVNACEQVIDGADVVIDAVFGIGFHGVLSPWISYLFDRIARCDAFKVAVDVPSGMRADDGVADLHAPCVDLTMTFAVKKRCMLLDGARDRCGVVVVCNIGLPSECLSRYAIKPRVITAELVRKGIPRRIVDSHKGTYANVYSLSGSYGMAGAAMLCGAAALRCGVGLLHCLIPHSIYPIVASQLWEAVCHPLEETTDHRLPLSEIERVVSMTLHKKGAFLCGPGLSCGEQTALFVRRLLPQITLPLVIDADGLNAYIGHIDEWKAITDRGNAVVVTPHPLEAARLLACTVGEVETDRIASARRLVELTGATVVLKGYNTVIADADGRVCVNTTGCSGLAKGGSGDVLAGMISALLAQGIEPFEACCSAVYLHVEAAVRVSMKSCETGMLPTDLLAELPLLLSDYERRE